MIDKYIVLRLYDSPYWFGLSYKNKDGNWIAYAASCIERWQLFDGLDDKVVEDVITDVNSSILNKKDCRVIPNSVRAITEYELDRFYKDMCDVISRT